MESTYTSFLQSPNASHLAKDASINYITTTTVINEPNAIIKHLQAQQKQVIKKEEKTLYSIESADSLVLETETTLRFDDGGGAYLPSMDGNLLDEKLVTFPLIHIVTFDADGKIKQIRLNWDQGTLLKQVEAVGRTGRNWPIRDGKAQVEAINRSVKSSGVQSSAKVTNGTRNQNEVVISQHKQNDSVSTSRSRDPQEIFLPRDTNVDAGSYDGPKAAPRASAKPPPRNYNELFAGQDSPSAEPGSKARSPSPNKAKAGAGKNYVGNRLFDDSERTGVARSPERKKVFGQKYDHFTFGDGEDVPQNGRPTSDGRSSKGAATFSFEDFATPLKHSAKVRRDDQVHWGADDPPSPPKRPIVHAARKDADPHFSLNDESTPAADRPKSSHAQQVRDIYDDPTAEDNQLKKSARTTAVRSDNSRRGDDFGAHYSMDDVQDENAAPNKGSSRADMQEQWNFGTPAEEKKIYRTAGDGMGSRKGADATAGGTKKALYKTAGDGMGGRRGGNRLWGFGDESDPEAEADIRKTARSRQQQQQQQQQQAGAAN